ncbi:hypothetical protein [Prevotellamassilia timonensis]|uniref:hypothetical protein n=1 Tax=Prevotellamassilia timonensis TaxID=1852370 RepID=UPI001F394A78|nr:hypothetical protein [Prevotellamassilia timonensis]MCF2634386.1 hypothetical protein [Prevotellamassilia timonensis]
MSSSFFMVRWFLSNPQKITCIIFVNLFGPYFLPHQSHNYGYAPSSGENLTSKMSFKSDATYYFHITKGSNNSGRRGVQKKLLEHTLMGLALRGRVFFLGVVGRKRVTQRQMSLTKVGISRLLLRFYPREIKKNAIFSIFSMR